MSNRLTFSLASLILIFAFAFVAMPAMAADGGPTVTITDNGTTASPSTRSAFKLKFTFSHSVTGFDDADDATFQLYDADEVLIGSPSNVGSPTPVTNSTKEYTAQIDVSGSSDQNPVGFIVKVLADKATGNTLGNDRGNQPKTQKFDLPPTVTTGSMALKITEATTQSSTTGTDYLLTLTYTPATGSGDPSTDPTPADIIVTPSYLRASVLSATDITDNTNDDGIFTVALVAPTGAPEATIGIRKTYIKGVKSVYLPPRAAVTQEPPSVAIAISGLDRTLRQFRVEVTLTPGMKSDGTAGDPVKGFGLDDLKITEAGGATVVPTEVAARKKDNSYVAILEYTQLDTLPLTVTTADAYKTSDDPKTTAGVGGDPTTPPVTGTPAAPTGLTATADQAADTVMLSWTAPTDDGGSAITGYTIAQTGQAADSYTATASPFTTPKLAAGDYSFTVAATNANGTGAASAAATATIDAAPVTPVHAAPTFEDDASIDPIVLWTGADYQSGELPLASHDEGDSLTYSFNPPLPAGLSLRSTDAQTRFIQGKPTAKAAEATYAYTATSTVTELKDEIEFKLTVNDPVVPTAPTIVSAMEEGAGATPRTINTNKVVVTWTGPTGDFGAAVTGYKVYWTGPENGNGMVDSATTMTFTTENALRIGSYDFQVAAVNSVGEGPKSTTLPVIVANVPDRPTNLSAALVPNTKTVTLNWLAPVNDGGAPITGYEVSVIDNLGTGRVRTFAVGAATTATTPTLDPGQYIFRVAAMNSDGKGMASDNTTPPTVVPTQPVDPANVKPTFGNATVDNITATVGTAIAGRTLPAATDPDGDDGDITYRLSQLPSGLNFNASTRYLSGTPTAASGLTTYTYTATDAGGATASLQFQIQVMPAPGTLPPTALIDSTISLPAMSIPAHGFVVLQRNPADSGIYDQVSDVVVGLANLDHLFRDKGGIALKGPGTARDLVFSEIMWGSDSSLADDTHSQWIELYNTTSSTLQLSNYMLEFYSARIGSTAGAIDEINTAAWGSLHGQRGRTSGVDTQGRFSEPVEIISMYRKINYARVEHSQARGDQLKDFPGGSGHGSWTASTRPSLNIAATWRLATPGTKPRYTIHGASSVRRHVIISEIGNSGTDAYDWFELYNTTDGEINLKKWQLSRVTDDGGKGKEVALLKFPDNDNIKIPAKSFLVIAASNPKNDGNDLAAGIDITKGAVNQIPRGLGQRGSSTVAHYAVLGFSLPNDAKRSLLILRTGHGNLGKAAGFEDVIGTLSIKLQGPVPSNWTGYDANNAVYYNTSLWPLHATGGPHGNVIDGGDEDFRAGKVYQRNNFGGGTGEKHLAVRGYTGIGYDRHAAVNAENGGTPGYSKDAVKGDKSNWAGQVTISEIMLVTEEGMGAARVPRATRLPQWFEIYNASMTEAVSINNWYLEIQNDDTPDFDLNLHGTLRLPNVNIQPNQTVLVVSGSGLNSGNFPEQRVINVFTNGTYRQILGITRRGEPMLNPKGFYIELRDHKGNAVDEIGNLGVSRRTGTDRGDNFGEQWEMPSLHSEDGHRTSLIRIYDNGRARSGLNGVGGPQDASTSWVLASNTNFQTVPSLTYYGNHRDYGTPGYRGGGPLPVSLSKFRPERLDSGEVVIRWVTESELNNAGFNILRSDTRGGEYTKINTQLIEGQGTTSERNTYEWKDTTAKPNVVYYYQIQDVSLDGQITTLRVNRLKGNVSAVDKVTTTWGELKALQ